MIEKSYILSTSQTLDQCIGKAQESSLNLTGDELPLLLLLLQFSGKDAIIPQSQCSTVFSIQRLIPKGP